MIIAEICQNHQGKPELVKKHVLAAAKAGAWAVKIQSFFADDLAPEWRERDYDRLKGLELNWEQHRIFAQTCKNEGVIPMTSVYTHRYLQEIHEAGIKHIKIGSAQANDEMLLKAYLITGFKVFVSTGGHHLGSLPHIRPVEAIFHCVSRYPTPPYEANLGRMLEIKKWWPNTAYGFSSHIDPLDPDWEVPLKLALYMGASYLECHFTILDRKETKDGPVSLDTNQLKEICDFDRLPSNEKLLKNPGFGIFKMPDLQIEKDLIEKYKGRWK